MVYTLHLTQPRQRPEGHYKREEKPLPHTHDNQSGGNLYANKHLLAPPSIL